MTASGFTTRTDRRVDTSVSALDERGLDGNERPPRDWKKAVLVLGLGALSWVATYVGMLELIEANMGALDLATRAIVAGSVAMLMVMIIWLLDQMFQPLPFTTKLIYAAGYVFLTLISVGFGFGFYWKVLESRSEASRSGESAVMQVKSGMHAAAARLGQLETTLTELTQVSTEQAELERTRGTSCPNSRPGDGPRRRLRDDDAARFGFAASFVKGRAGQVRTEMASLDADLAKIASRDAATFDKTTGTRNEFLKGLGRKLELAATGFNAFRTDPQLRQIRADLAERADKTVFPDTKGGTFACPDAKLQTALKGVVRAIDQLPELAKPHIATVEGSEAVIEAFRRLTATFAGALTLRLPPSADELRDLQRKAVQSAEAGGSQRAQAIGAEQAGLARRDYVPLAIAVFVDLCLLLVSMGRTSSRMSALVPKMRAAERGPIYPILSMFSEIHRDPEIREKFEVFRHVVFDFNGDYYVAVPLNAPYNLRRGRYDLGYSSDAAADLQLEAHLLANLFASFEQERIFARVYNPLLTTRAIQKKLWRQGSKFAGADAFRLYRFKKGAWSDIILGAVMGAARRAEAERRRRAVAAGHTLDMPTSTPGHAQPIAPGASESDSARLATMLREAATGTDRRQPPQDDEPAHRSPYAGEPRGFEPKATAAPTSEDLVRQYGPYAAAAAGIAENMAAPQADPGRPRRHYGPRARPPEEAEVAIDQLPVFQALADMPATSNVVAMPRRVEPAQTSAAEPGPAAPRTPMMPPAFPAMPLAAAEAAAPAPDMPTPAMLIDHVMRQSESLLARDLSEMPRTMTVRLAEVIVARETGSEQAPIGGVDSRADGADPAASVRAIAAEPLDIEPVEALPAPGSDDISALAARFARAKSET
ncbi:MAG: hypothetical protein R3D27_04575 [Hyphomicrobiaceae bacterium]